MNLAEEEKALFPSPFFSPLTLYQLLLENCERLKPRTLVTIYFTRLLYIVGYNTRSLDQHRPPSPYILLSRCGVECRNLSIAAQLTKDLGGGGAASHPLFLFLISYSLFVGTV